MSEIKGYFKRKVQINTYLTITYIVPLDFYSCRIENKRSNILLRAKRQRTKLSFSQKLFFISQLIRPCFFSRFRFLGFRKRSFFHGSSSYLPEWCLLISSCVFLSLSISSECKHVFLCYSHCNGLAFSFGPMITTFRTFSASYLNISFLIRHTFRFRVINEFWG